jgi:hypothetical protein
MKAIATLSFVGFAFATPAMAACPTGFDAASTPACEVGVPTLVSADSSCWVIEVMAGGNQYAIQYQPGVGLAASPAGGPATNWQVGLQTAAFSPGPHTFFATSGDQIQPQGICGRGRVLPLVSVSAP